MASRIFWDSNLFIYLLEDHPQYSDRVDCLRRRMTERRDQLYTSTLAVGEILVKPIRMGRLDVASKYESFFTTPDITVLPFDMKAARLFSEFRQNTAISRPDAIHLACAASAGIDLFITNDDRLSRISTDRIHFISSLAKAPL